MNTALPPLRLIALTPSLLAQYEAAHSKILHHLQEQAESYRRLQNLLEDTLAAKLPTPWCGYLALDDEAKDVLGACAFRAPPHEEGVEILYYVLPHQQGHSYGVRMVTALEQLAQANNVFRVRAHTPMRHTGSTRVLEKAGYLFVGPFEDEDLGLAWRWEKDLRSHH